MKTDLFSVITVSYNSEATIRDTIRSVNRQTYHNIEHIFIDGGSSDNTVDIITRESTVKNRVISEKDEGIYDAMNKGIELSSGKFVAILNSDDCFANDNVLFDVIGLFNNDVDIVYGNISYFNDSPESVVRIWRTSKYYKDAFSRGWHPPHPAFFVARKAYVNYGLFNTRYRIAADYELMLRFLEIKGLKYEFIDKVLVHMRLGGESNRSVVNVLKGNKEIRVALSSYGIERGLTFTIIRICKKIRQYL
ncbi:MAG: glycosyltransferase [Bacteroidetes bacterium]|nr:glycosyltransferase [Bacteroidota bacterium]